jgi:hypothetical protein
VARTRDKEQGQELDEREEEQEEEQQEEEGRVDGQAGRQRAGAVVRRKHRGDDEQTWSSPALLWDANWSPGATITPAAPAPAPAARPKLRNPRPRGIRVVGDWVG